MATRPLRVLTPPTDPPAWLAELKLALRVNLGTVEDALLTRWLAAARQQFEARTGRAVLPTAFRQSFAGFDALELVRAPVLSVDAVGYLDADGEEQELDGWRLDADEVPAVVYLPGGAYPTTAADRRWPVWVDFTAGYADADAVPAAVVTAVQLLAAHLYRHREATTDAALADLPHGFAAVCDLWDTGLTRGA